MFPSNQPFNKALAITTSDTVDLPQGVSRAIWVGGAGTVAVVFQDGSTASFTCVAGQLLPVGAKRVNATGTSATLLLALYQV